MKIFAQLVELSTSQRSEAFSGTKEQLAVIFMEEKKRRQKIESERNDPLLPKSNLAVIVIVEDAQSPVDFRFSTCPIMTVSAFHRWVFPQLDLEKVTPDIQKGVDDVVKQDAVNAERENYPQIYLSEDDVALLQKFQMGE